MKMVKLKPYLLVFLLLFLGTVFSVSNAQEHVFTKSIFKSINVANRNITIDAEKANITITEAEDDNFTIDLKFVSKHTDKQRAEKQLSYMNHILNIKNKEVYLRNYILISSGKELSGSIQAEYVLKIPKNKIVSITNSLGNIEVENIEGNFSINTKYGNITLQNITGKLDLYGHIGELRLENCYLNSKIETKYISSYYINNKGSYNVISNMGTLNFSLNKTISNLTINASGTEIVLLNKNCIEFNLNLISQYGNIDIDKCNTPKQSFINLDSRDSDKDKKEFIYYNPKVNNNISVKNKFANISTQ